MNNNYPLTSSSAQFEAVQSGYPKNQPDKMMKSKGPQIPPKACWHSAPDYASLPDLTVSIVDVKPEFIAIERARLKMPLEMTSAPPQTSTTAEITPDALTYRFQILCNSDDGEELAYLLSNIDEATRGEWFSSSLTFSEKQDTPMMYAARHGHAAVVAALISYQANPCENNPLSNYQCNALTLAAQENQAEVIREMAKSKYFNPDEPRGDGITAMIMAIQAGHDEITKILLELKADPNYKVRLDNDYHQGGFIPSGSFGDKESLPSSQLLYTPVMHVASHGKPIILEQLLAKGGNPNNIDLANPLQQSPLRIALSSKKSSAEVIKLLLKYKADMHERVVPANGVFKNITHEKNYLLPTVFETACHFAAMKQSSQPEHIAEVFCDYYRTPEGEKIDSSILQLLYAGQGFLKNLALDSCYYDHLRTNLSLQHYLTRTLSLFTALFSAFGKEESSESPDEKAFKVFKYTMGIQPDVTKAIDDADRAMLQEMVVTVLKRFNDCNLDFNDESVTKYLGMIIDLESYLKEIIE